MCLVTNIVFDSAIATLYQNFENMGTFHATISWLRWPLCAMERSRKMGVSVLFWRCEGLQVCFSLWEVISDAGFNIYGEVGNTQ